MKAPAATPQFPNKAKKPSKSAKAVLVARAKAAGWESTDIHALESVIDDVQSLTDAQTERARCRLGKVFQARKPVVLTALREAGATHAELESAGRAVDGVAAGLCSGASTKSHEVALGRVFLDVNHRLTAGTSLAGHNVLLDGFDDLVRELAQRCPGSSNLTMRGLASLSDAEFDDRLGSLAYGSCQQSSSSSGGISGLPALPSGTDANGYAQCVRDAFRQGVTSTAECQDIAGGDGDGEDGGGQGGQGGDGDSGSGGDSGNGGNSGSGGDSGSGGNSGSGGDSSSANAAMDEHDETSYAIGCLVVFEGAVLVVTGVATSEVGVGVGIAAIGAAMIVGGLEHMDEQSARYIERNGRRAWWALWQCPAINTPVGSFAFANPAAGGTSGQANMTIMDTIRACRCENNPIDDFLAEGGTGAFGGPSCELGSRLDCLRESGNDVATPLSPECRQLVRGDNHRSIAARMQECAVINCGDGLVGDDCSCWAGGGSGGGGASQDPCAMVRCPSGALPVPNGQRCTCESDVTPGGSGGNCLPGTPGCGGGNTPTIPGRIPGGVPNGLPGGGSVPIPKPMPKSLPKSMPKPMGK